LPGGGIKILNKFLTVVFKGDFNRQVEVVEFNIVYILVLIVVLVIFV